LDGTAGKKATAAGSPTKDGRFYRYMTEFDLNFNPRWLTINHGVDAQERDK